MRAWGVAVVMSAVSLVGCAASNDQLAQLDAQNRQLSYELQRERAMSAQAQGELQALRAQTFNLQRQLEFYAQREREAGAARPPVPEARGPDQPRADSPPKPREPPRPAKEMDTAVPKDSFTNQAIDSGFRQWSSTWMFDRYIPGSAHATDRGFKGGTYVIRGLFDFVRGGARLTIPFAAAFTGTQDAYRLSNLCYNDHTSGMTDCIDPSNQMQHAAAQSRQFLGSIVLLGLAAAMTAPDEICEKHTSIFGDSYLTCY